MNGKHRPRVIGIAGGTGAGKTTVAKAIVKRMPAGQAALIQHDWYYKGHPNMPLEKRAALNYDEPGALENTLLAEHIRMLKSGQGVECPQYDFQVHLRKNETMHVEPCRIIVIEGILAFSVPLLRDLFDLRIFVDTADDIRLIRRIKRDLKKRGRDIDSIQHQYYETVRPMHRTYVEPAKDHAHIIIPEGGENKHAIDLIVDALLYGLSPA
ncbi:MAG: uridine kinase [Deltaproteobacteria bacterium]|nr:uridine kinase [Deltaproteobacteria bacterium]